MLAQPGGALTATRSGSWRLSPVPLAETASGGSVMPILVTGGTGTLGRPFVAALRAAGQQVRVLSRRQSGEVAVADLLTGAGLAQALHGVEVVVHLATCRRDDDATQNLVVAARRAGVRHVVARSIVGIDTVPLPSYRRKLRSELLVEQLLHTILRTTKFHDLVNRLFSVRCALPVLVAPAFALQPIDVVDLAPALVPVASGPPRGRPPALGGPQALEAVLLAEQWRRAHQDHRRVRTLRLPGKIFAAYREGRHLTSDLPSAERTFEPDLTRHAERR